MEPCSQLFQKESLKINFSVNLKVLFQISFEVQTILTSQIFARILCLQISFCVFIKEFTKIISCKVMTGTDFRIFWITVG